MFDLKQLKACNEAEWNKVYGGQITLNCEDVDKLIKAFEIGCGIVAKITHTEREEWINKILNGLNSKGENAYDDTDGEV